MKLYDVIEKFIPGDWGEESFTQESPYSVHCVRGADFVPIENNEYGDIPCRYISEKSSNSKMLNVGDIIIEKSGGSPTQSTGRVCYISQEVLDAVDNKLVCSNFCVAFRCKKEWNPLYIYYYMKFVYDLGIFFNFEGKTSGLKNLQTEIALKSIPIVEIDKKEQDMYMRFFEDVEKKLAVSRCIVKSLRNQIETIYDYWFKQFDFPDVNGKSYRLSGGEMVYNENIKREIPKGWDVVKIGDILDKVPSTQKYDTKQYQKRGKYPIIDQGPSYIVGFTDESENLLDKHPAVVFGDHSTNVKFVDFQFARGADGTQILYSKEKRIPPYYFYLCVKSIKIPNPGYSRHFKYLKDMFILVPDTKVSEQFEKIAEPIYKRITSAIFENIKTENMRNDIMPMLMSNQLNFICNED